MKHPVWLSGLFWQGLATAVGKDVKGIQDAHLPLTVYTNCWRDITVIDSWFKWVRFGYTC